MLVLTEGEALTIGTTGASVRISVHGYLLTNDAAALRRAGGAQAAAEDLERPEGQTELAGA